MFENQTEEQVVEEVLDTPESTDVEKTSAEEAPTAPAEVVAEIKDYLNPDFFRMSGLLTKMNLSTIMKVAVMK